MKQNDKSRAVHSWKNPFHVKNDNLLINNIPITLLAKRVGKTPFYAYDRSLILERVRTLKEALGGRLDLHYALKANPMPALVCLLATAVDGFDIASAGELKVALDAGMQPGHISFAGPGKREEELLQAVAADVTVNVESVAELRRLEAIARSIERTARIALRINPDFELKSSGMKMGGGPKPFGIDAEQAPEILRSIASEFIALEGFHIFAGSQNLRAEALIETQTKSYELAARLSSHLSSPPKTINLGGGFGIQYFPGDQALELTSVTRHLLELSERASQELPGTRLAIELGRYIVGEAGVYVCRVTDKKLSRGKRFLVVDGGLHQHLAASGNFGQVVRRNYPSAIANRMHAEPVEEVTVVGPLCTPLDVMAENVALPVAEPGDLFAIFQSGAYGASASPQAFLGHPPPIEVLV